VGVAPLGFLIGCFAYDTENFFTFVVHAWRWCLILSKEQTILIH
jgi:hypothetical protein